MSRLIDADALERDGWKMHRTVQVDKDNMLYQVKRPTDFLVVEPERKKGKWMPQDHNIVNGMASTTVYYYPKCSVCGQCANYTNFCPNCGSDMRDNQDD